MKPQGKVVWRSASAIALLFVPVVALSATPLRPAAVLVFVGMIPALQALLHSRRWAIVTAVGTAMLVAVIGWVNPHPVAATILMTAIGLGIGAAGLRGWNSVATVACSWPAVLLIGPPVHIPGAGWVLPLIVLAGGLWVVVAGLLLPSLPPASAPARLDRGAAVVYGISLALLLGVSTFVTATWMHGTTAGWVLLTILVIARPGFSETWRRIVTRSLGTLAGGVAAAALALLLPHPALLTVAGVVALITAIVLQLKKVNYAVYAFALTAAIVLLSSRTGDDVYATDLQRVAYTVAGALLTAALVAVLEVSLNRTERDVRRHRPRR